MMSRFPFESEVWCVSLLPLCCYCLLKEFCYDQRTLEILELQETLMSKSEILPFWSSFTNDRKQTKKIKQTKCQCLSSTAYAVGMSGWPCHPLIIIEIIESLLKNNYIYWPKLHHVYVHFAMI